MAKAFVRGNKVGLVMTKKQAELLARLLYSHVAGPDKGLRGLLSGSNSDQEPILSALFTAGVKVYDENFEVEGRNIVVK